MSAIKKAFDLMGDDIVELSTRNEFLKNKKGSYDKNCLEESKAQLSKQIDDEKRTSINMFRMRKPMKKHLKSGIYFL